MMSRKNRLRVYEHSSLKRSLFKRNNRRLRRLCTRGTSQHLIRIIISRRMRWAVYVAGIGETELWSENLKRSSHLADIGVHGGIILEWILENKM
jgi:hypothetical protein